MGRANGGLVLLLTTPLELPVNLQECLHSRVWAGRGRTGWGLALEEECSIDMFLLIWRMIRDAMPLLTIRQRIIPSMQGMCLQGLSRDSET